MHISNDPLPAWAPKMDDIIRIRRLDNGSGSLSELKDPEDIVVGLVHFYARDRAGDDICTTCNGAKGWWPEGAMHNAALDWVWCESCNRTGKQEQKLGRLRIMGNSPAQLKNPMFGMGMGVFFLYGPEDFEVVGDWKHETEPCHKKTGNPCNHPRWEHNQADGHCNNFDGFGDCGCPGFVEKEDQ
jgi:hypothetical protein